MISRRSIVVIVAIAITCFLVSIEAARKITYKYTPPPPAEPASDTEEDNSEQAPAKEELPKPQSKKTTKTEEKVEATKKESKK